MKKISYLFLVMSILMLMSSCGKKSVKGPDEILTEGKVIKYSYTLEQVEKKLGEGKTDDRFMKHGYSSYEYFNDLIILYNEEDKLRLIHIEDEDIKTYKNICVGDDIDKAKANFKYGIDSANHSYTVYFEGNSEFDASDKEKLFESDWMIITYKINEDDEIERISIMDKDYALLMK